MANGAIQEAFDRAVQRAIHRNQHPAIVGKGDADRTLEDSSRPGFVWVRLQYPGDSSPVLVRVNGVAPAYGAPILVEKKRDGFWETVEPDGTSVIEYKAGSGYEPSVAPHAGNHQRLGIDPLLVHALQYQPFLCHPTSTGSLSVYVEQAIYLNSSGQSAAWLGGSIDLTSKVPGTPDYQRVIIVGLDTDTGTLTTADADAVLIEGVSNLLYMPFNLSNAVAVDLPDNFEPSAGVRLYYGQSRIDTWDIFADRRNWFGSSGASSGTSGLALQPTVIDTDYTVPPNYQAVWAEGFRITTGSLIVDGDVYIIG